MFTRLDASFNALFNPRISSFNAINASMRSATTAGNRSARCCRNRADPALVAKTWSMHVRHIMGLLCTLHCTLFGTPLIVTP